MGCTPTVKEVALHRGKSDIVVVKKGRFLFSEEEERFIRKEAKHLGMEIPSNRDVDRHLRAFLRNKRSLETALKRAKLYIPHIREILSQYDLPQELSLLPLIESGFNPFAVSSSGAAGIWQLMPATARRYGLRVDDEIDERFDLFKSTHAASRYLRDLYKRFHNWSLVLAAYNCGEGCVSRRTKGADFWRSKWALPEQTRKYVPMFFAALLIAKSPEKFGLKVNIEGFRLRREVVNRDTHIRTFIADKGIKESTFRDLNPHIRSNIIPAGAQVYTPVTAVANTKQPAVRTIPKKPKVKVIRKVAKAPKRPPLKKAVKREKAPERFTESKKTARERIVIKGSQVSGRRTKIIRLDNGALLYIKE